MMKHTLYYLTAKMYIWAPFKISVYGIIEGDIPIKKD